MKNKTIIAVAAAGFMSVVSLIAMSSLQPNPKSVEMLEISMGQPGFVSSRQQTAVKNAAVKNGKKNTSKADKANQTKVKTTSSTDQAQKKYSNQRKAQKKAERVKTKTTSKKLDLNSNVCPCLNKPKPKPPVTGNKIETFNKRPL